MKTIPLPDNFPQPKYQLGQVAKMLSGQTVSNCRTPILGLIVGIKWINPATAELIGWPRGWLYFLSFVDMPGLPEGFNRNLEEECDWAEEADLEVV